VVGIGKPQIQNVGREDIVPQKLKHLLHYFSALSRRQPIYTFAGVTEAVGKHKVVPNLWRVI